MFKAEGTAIGHSVRSREPMIINDTAAVASDYLDVNVLHTSGFQSGMVIPLVTKREAVGTLNVVSRRPGAFDQSHADALSPITEIFAVAYVAQQTQTAMTRQRAMEAMTDVAHSVSAEINNAIQAIIGHCDLLDRGYPDPNLQRYLATVVHQAQRISNLLEKMRRASMERMAASSNLGKLGNPPQV